jgi:predicted DCC family thiol-disulfide oxidoreductase YuxK
VSTLLFDGHCGFCRAWVERWRERAQGAFEARPYQEWPGSAPPREELAKAVHFVAGDGHVSRGAEAVFDALATNPATVWPQWLYRHLPGFRGGAERVYRLVTAHRSLATRLGGWAWGGATPPSHQLTRALFLRGLALIYAIAFVSFWVQARGLVGHDGIWPLGQYMALVHEQLGASAWWQTPTIFLLNASDTALNAVCAGGVVLALALAAGLWPRGALAALWFLYLSLENGVYLFLGYQWDLLLLEVGLLAIPFAPAGFWPRGQGRPLSWPSLWMLRWLLFRLMFMSGAVKLLSHDATWRDFTALEFHYWTQPLPTWTSALAADLSPSFQHLSCALMFAVELGIPFLIFGTRWLRLAACGALVALQLLILGTGNYGFFNWLTILLCLPLLDDRVLGRLVPARRRAAARPTPAVPIVSLRLRRAALGAFAFVYAVASGGTLVLRFERHGDASPALAHVLSVLSPLRSINGYGLFAVMTVDRSEIVVEGSDDGQTWKPYEFPWKPGRIDRSPAFVAPHQPRLDWQMWFAALGSCQRNPWFLEFQKRLLEGAPAVTALLDQDPFAGRAPRFVRSTRYQYRFTSKEQRAQGVWWTRTAEGPYCPELTLKDGELAAVR